MTAIDLVTETGEKVGRLEVSLSPPEPRPQEPRKSLEWYLGGVKWLVTLAVAALAIGISWFETRTPGPVAATLLAASGLGLLTAAGAGLMCYLWIVAFADAEEKEQRGRIARESEAELGKLKEKADRAYKLLSRNYNVLVWSFGVGFLLLSIGGSVRLFEVTRAHTPATSLLLVPVEARTPSGAIAILSGASGAGVSVLQDDAKGGYQLVPVETSGRPSGSVAKSGTEPPRPALEPVASPPAPDEVKHQ